MRADIYQTMKEQTFRYSSQQFSQTLFVAFGLSAMLFFFDRNPMLARLTMSGSAFAILFFLLVFRKTLLEARLLADRVVLTVGYPYCWTKQYEVPYDQLTVIFEDVAVKKDIRKRVFTIHHDGQMVVRLVPDAQGWSRDMLQELYQSLP